MSPELKILAIGAIILVMAAVIVSRLHRHGAASTATTQLAIGLLCGAVAALLAAVPYADAVPDGAEVGVGVVAGITTIPVGVFGLMRWREHRRVQTRREARR